MKSILPAFLLLCLATASNAQTPNNTLRGKVLYQSSGNKPAVGVRIVEPDANPTFSIDNGDYLLKFQNKRNGAALSIEVGKDNGKSQKLELVNEKEVKAAKLPADAESILEIIVCPAGQRDIAAQKYYRILRTTADRELEKKKKEVETLLAQKEKDYQKISDLFAQLDGVQAALDSVKIKEQSFMIASINLDRASQMVKNAVQKIEHENDVQGALRILSVEALDTAYRQASVLKKNAEAAIQQVIEGYEFKISLLESQFMYRDIAECNEKIADIGEKEGYDKAMVSAYLATAATYWARYGQYPKALDLSLNALSIIGTDASQEAILTLYGNLGFAYGKMGEVQKQLEYDLKAIAIIENKLPSDHAQLATLYHNLAYAYGDLGQNQEQLEFNLKALKIREKVLAVDDPELARTYNNLAATYGKLGAYQKQLEYDLKALSIRERVLPPNHPDLARSYNNLAGTYGSLGEYQSALKFNLIAIEIWQKVLPENHPDLAASYHNLAAIYSSFGEYESALNFELKAIGIWEKRPSWYQEYLAWSYFSTGYIYLRLGQYTAAKPAFDKCEEVSKDGMVFLGWAMYYALKNDKKYALENLKKAVSFGYTDLSWIETNDLLENIRGEQGYKDIVEQLKKQ